VGLWTGSAILWVARKLLSIQKIFSTALDAPIVRVSQEDVPLPYNDDWRKRFAENKEKLSPRSKKFVMRETG